MYIHFTTGLFVAIDLENDICLIIEAFYGILPKKFILSGINIIRIMLQYNMACQLSL